MPDAAVIINLAQVEPFLLGELEVDPPRRRVSTGETLEPRVMQVLVALARANGAVVSRDELIRTCWDGRVVGEDSITRVIVRLRKLAEEGGGAAFKIETVPKVGYRLVGDVQPVVAPLPSPPPIEVNAASVAPITQKPVAASITRKKSTMAIAVMTAIVAAGGTWWLTKPAPASPAVQFTGYRILGAVPAMLPEAIAAETRSAFTVDGIVGVTTGAAPYRLTGTLGRTGDGAAAATRLAVRIDTTAGTTLWAHTYERPLASANAATWFASRTVGIARCGAARLTGAAPVSDDAQRLIFAGCAEESEGAAPFKGLDIARRLTVLAPNLSSSWATLAYLAVGASIMVPQSEASALRAEAVMASDKALAIDPKDARAWQARAWLRPKGDFAGQERAFLAAVQGNASDCGKAFVQYGQFLIGVGRAKEARRWLERGHDVAPLQPEPHAALGRLNAQEGHLEEARRNFADLDALSASPQATGRTLVSNALWTRDYARAADIAAANRPSDPAVQTTIVTGFHALASGDVAAKARVAALLDVQTTECECNGTFNARMLAALGATDAALRQLEAIATKRPDIAIEAVSQDPVFARVRYLPGFAPIAGKLGLIAYWRAKKIKPDYCAGANAPPVCRII